jgi:hypothetical protein
VTGSKDIGRACQIGKSGQEGFAFSGSALPQRYGLSTIVPFYLLQFVGYAIQGFVPSYPFPFAFSSLPCSLHRILEPVRMIDKLLESETFTAHRTMVGGEVRVTLNLGNDTISNVNQHPTTAVTASTITPYYLFFTIDIHAHSASSAHACASTRTAPSSL